MSEVNQLVEAARHGDVERATAILDKNAAVVNERDDSGATPLHYAAFHGHRTLVELLVARGANVNSYDSGFGATPTGWAIEYLRDLGGFLATDLDDLAFAIRISDIRWVKRFLTRFPSLRTAVDKQGTPFRRLAQESGNTEIVKLFETETD